MRTSPTIASKALSRQVAVITGASSGAGSTAAIGAAGRGARVVVAARNGTIVSQIAADIRARGGRAIAVETDMSVAGQVRHLATRALETFGSLHTWVNVAGIDLVDELTDIDVADHRRSVDETLRGFVNGSRVAAAHLRSGGGTIINVGAMPSDVALPFRGMCLARGHAVKGFNDALRSELMNAEAPISVTSIERAGVDEGSSWHATNATDREPTSRSSIARPKDVAAVMLHAAEHCGRDDIVGSGRPMMSSLSADVSSATARMASTRGAGMQLRAGASRRNQDGLRRQAGRDGQTEVDPMDRGHRGVRARTRLRSFVTAGLMTAAALAGAALISYRED